MVAAPSPLQTLADAASSARRFRLEAQLNLADGKTVEVFVHGAQGPGGRSDHVLLRERKGDKIYGNSIMNMTGVEDGLRQVAAKYPGAVLLTESVKVTIQKGTTTGGKVGPVAVQAWCEAYGLPIPSLDDLAGGRKAAKAAGQAESGATLALLKTGPAGVAAFNRRGDVDKNKADLRKADLAGCDLSGIELANLTEATGAKLAGAKLARATVVGAKFADADFSDADLTGASLRGCSFLRSNLTKANLTDANLGYSDFRGADFRGAKMTRCVLNQAKFDEKTRWPKGFKPPPEVIWKGAGADPRPAPTVREKSRPAPTDFAGFLKRMNVVADPGKLDKAMTMLKADRFRLFAKVEASQVVGVVKSQSDPTLVYACRLGEDGKFSCCTQNLNVCGGLRGSPCKHLLVLIMGLTKAGELDLATAHAWTQASRGKKPELDKDAMAETLLSYKGAEAGEIDCRRTEIRPLTGRSLEARPVDEIAELRDALDRLHAAAEDLVVRGARAAGPRDLARLSALRDEFRSAGAEHLAGRLTTLVDLVRADDRAAAPALLRAMTSFRLFDRMLTLDVAARALAAAAAGAEDGPASEGD